MALNENVEAFVIYVFSPSLKLIYPDKEVQIASLIIEEITISDKYSDFAKVFL